MPKTTYADAVIGPRRVGGTYFCGYWSMEYTVVSIALDESTGIPWITVRWTVDGRHSTHSTAWDVKRDRVIA